jgi:cysteine desulfurase
MSFNGAKVYGAKGIGVLYVKKNTPIQNIMFGGDQEFGLRPGTENVTLAKELSRGLKFIQKNKEKEINRLVNIRDYFVEKLRTLGRNDLIINGDLKNRLPNSVNVTFSKVPSDLLVIELSEKGIMVSSKSACRSHGAESSYVIKAIRKDVDFGIGGLRFSLGAGTNKKDIDYTVKTLAKILQKLEKWYD